MFDALFTHLTAQDVVVDTYSFVDDPRVCVSDATAQVLSLRDVLERHHRATLVVCGETLCAFNRVTGRLLPWVETIPAHVDRIFVTTEAPDRWTEREFELERAGFIVLPGERCRLACACGSRPAAGGRAPFSRAVHARISHAHRRRRTAVARSQRSAGARPLQRLLRELKGFLGADGFAWMCACAVYPEISWALTLRFEATCRPRHCRRSAGCRGSATRSCRAWLRGRCHQNPAGDRAAAAQRISERLLEELARRPTPSNAGSRLQIGRWVGPIDLAAATAPGSPLQDQVFLGFMTGGHHPLSFHVARALTRLFKKRPEAFADDRTGETAKRSFVSRLIGRMRLWSLLNRRTAHAAAAMVIAGIALIPFTKLLAVAEVTGSNEVIWFVEIPGGPTTIGAPNTRVVNLREFFIGRTEVTVAQYQACVDAGACTPGQGRRQRSARLAGEQRQLGRSDAVLQVAGRQAARRHQRDRSDCRRPAGSTRRPHPLGSDPAERARVGKGGDGGRRAAVSVGECPRRCPRERPERENPSANGCRIVPARGKPVRRAGHGRQRSGMDANRSVLNGPREISLTPVSSIPTLRQRRGEPFAAARSTRRWIRCGRRRSI